MATVVKDLGAVTAYAYAVAGGYSGTEAEFEALLGNIAEDLSEIENLSVTVTTLPAGSSATASYSNGVLSLGIPKGDKGDKGDTGATGATGPTGNGISTITKTGTSGLVDTYTITFTNGDTTTFTVTNGEDGEVTTAQMNAAIETALEDYAKVDGSYSSLTSGNAEQLVSTVGVNDKTPYLFRTTGGSADVGDRVKVSEITGGTVAWNQLATTEQRTISVTPDGAYTYSTSSVTVSTKANHVYFIAMTVKNYNGGKTLRAYCQINAAYGMPAQDLTGTSKAFAWLCKPSAGSASINYGLSNLATADKLTSADAWTRDDTQVIDLTAMFGSTIADYLFGLESGTAGAGVAKLKSWGFCTKDYYAYDAGSLLSVKTTAHKTIGFNAYNPDTGKAKVVGGQAYQITGTYTALSLDGTSITPDASGYFTPAASGEITVTGGNATDTCIHLKWDGERDGEYEPYEEHSYPLDSDLELRGIPKLDANNNLYYDGDVYEASGTVTRKRASKKRTSEAWQYYGTAEDGFWYLSDFFGSGVATISEEVKNPKSLQVTIGNERGQIRCYPKYNIGIITNETNMDIVFPTGSEFIVKRTTPTTESADPYQETQICNDFGTEEFVDSRTVPMPVGANALYQANLRAKLEMAPDSPDGDGDYIVRQTDGLNEYVAVSSNSTISGLSTRCPACPTDTDGTFVLKATVSSGTVTYAWTAE